jgi:sulfatase-modifying factor enzyme 1
MLLASAAGAGGPPSAPLTKCPVDAVVSGSTCTDKYEASVWRVPNATTTNAGLVKKIRQGKATPELLAAGGATRLGLASDDYAPCNDNGQNCANDIYAVSLGGVIPSGSITWFQAQEACANAGKHLPTNAEWQMAANGTPDPGPDNGTTDCNTASSFAVAATGSRSACVSARGAFDMVGNLNEFVGDWVPATSACPGWGAFSNDIMCFSGANASAPGPGILLRGGGFADGSIAGPLMILGQYQPSGLSLGIGFRCVR